MKLTELKPEFMTIDVNTKIMSVVENNENADGIIFLCPKCFEKNNGPVGTHMVLCWKPRVPQTIDPIPGRWDMLGKSFDDLTFKAGSSSIALKGGCNAHFFITNGNIKIV